MAIPWVLEEIAVRPFLVAHGRIAGRVKMSGAETLTEGGPLRVEVTP